jgi:nitrogen fixation/metabolism regulation signal transduction histidine kinase
LDKSRRHLSNYILDRALQMRYIVLVTFLSAGLSGMLGYLVYQQEHSATQNIIATLENTDFSPELKTEIIDSLDTSDTSLILLMVGVGFGMVVVLSMYLVIMTHKVAGPLHKVSRYFYEMTDGRLSEVEPLRRGDHLTGFYESFKAMHDAVRQRQGADLRVLERFVAACQAAGLGGANDFGHKLEEVQAYHRKRRAEVAGAG